ELETSRALSISVTTPFATSRTAVKGNTRGGSRSRRMRNASSPTRSTRPTVTRSAPTTSMPGLICSPLILIVPPIGPACRERRLLLSAALARPASHAPAGCAASGDVGLPRRDLVGGVARVVAGRALYVAVAAVPPLPGQHLPRGLRVGPQEIFGRHDRVLVELRVLLRRVLRVLPRILDVIRHRRPPIPARSSPASSRAAGLHAQPVPLTAHAGSPARAGGLQGTDPPDRRGRGRRGGLRSPAYRRARRPRSAASAHGTAAVPDSCWSCRGSAMPRRASSGRRRCSRTGARAAAPSGGPAP